MKRNLVLFNIALVFFAGSVLGQENAASRFPHAISYQGYVTDASHAPLAGNHTLAIRLYDAPTGGNVLHSEQFSTAVTAGVFSVILGSEQPLESSLAFDRQYWLGVSVDNSDELSPRTTLLAAPYAIRSDIANSLSSDALGAVRSINGRSGDFTVKGGEGMDIQTAGNTITISAAQIRNAQPQGNGNVSGVAGTANQVLVNGTSGIQQSGNLTLTTPQDIAAASSPSFAGMTLSGMGTGVVHSGSAGLLSSSLVSNADVSSTAGITYSKLALSNSIVNGDVSATAGITYGKLALANSITNNDINASAAIADSKLATISSASKVANSATTATSTNTPNTIVLRDGSGNFSAGTITGTVLSLSGKGSAAATVSSDPSNCLATKGYVDNATSTEWSINGNGGTSSANYLGTTDANALSIRTAATERLKITSDGSLLASGTSGSVPASGFGTRMMWIPSLGAFRAGKANSSEWNSGNVGTQSFAAGYGDLASGSQSVAMGYFSSAYGFGSTASGSGASSFADGATAFGSGSQAVGFNSVAIGDNSTAWSDDAVAIGSNTSATGFAATTMGYQTTTNGNYAMATGKNLTVGLSSFGFNGSTTNSIVDVSGIHNLAYFGDVDLAIGNDDNTARGLRLYGRNTSPTLSTAKYTSFKAGIQSANITYTLPTAQGSGVLTNNGTGTLGWVSQNAAYASVGAGDEIDIPGNTNVVKIEDDGDNTTANLLVLPGGTNGQTMYIYNNDGEATTGDAIINSGATGIFIYADGWRKAN